MNPWISFEHAAIRSDKIIAFDCRSVYGVDRIFIYLEGQEKPIDVEFNDLNFQRLQNIAERLDDE